MVQVLYTKNCLRRRPKKLHRASKKNIVGGSWWCTVLCVFQQRGGAGVYEAHFCLVVLVQCKWDWFTSSKTYAQSHGVEREFTRGSPHHSSSNATATPTKQHFCFETQQQHSTWEVQQGPLCIQGSTVQLGTLKIFWKEMPNLLAPLGVERSWLWCKPE